MNFNKAMILVLGVTTMMMSFHAGAVGIRKSPRTRGMQSAPVASTPVAPSKVDVIGSLIGKTTATAPTGTTKKPTANSSLFEKPATKEAAALNAGPKNQPAVDSKKDEPVCSVDAGFELVDEPVAKTGILGASSGEVTYHRRCVKSPLLDKFPEIFGICGGNPYVKMKDKDTVVAETCRSAFESSLMNPCAEKAKEARTAYSDFQKACAETSLGGAKACLDEAASCALALEENEDTEEWEDEEEDNAFLAKLGLDTTEGKDKKETIKTCSELGMKDYQTEKRELGRSLRDVEKDMGELAKDLAREKEDSAKKKKELQQDFIDLQKEVAKAKKEGEQAVSDASMAVSEQLMQIDQQKADIRMQNIDARLAAAKIIGQRASEMAGLTDAMIDTNCMVELETAIAAMKIGMTPGVGNYLQTQGERRRRLKAIKIMCYERYHQARNATYRQYRAELDRIDESVNENSRRLEAMDQQKTQIIQRQKETETRNATAQSDEATASYQSMQAIYTQMQELDTADKARVLSAGVESKQADDRMNEIHADIKRLGKAPKGKKSPSEALAQFKIFKGIYDTIEGDTSCKNTFDALTNSLAKEKITDHVDGTYEAPEKDDDDDGRD